VSVGYVADAERTSFPFLEQITENAGKFNRSERFSRSFVDEILSFESSKRIGASRLKPAYWFDSDAFVKGVLIRKGGLAKEKTQTLNTDQLLSLSLTP